MQTSDRPMVLGESQGQSLSTPDDTSTEWADDVSLPSHEYKVAKKRWDIVDITLGDTLSVRDCREAVLPKLPHEKKGYENRLKQIEFTPWFRRLVSGLVGVVLRKPPITTGLQPQIQRHIEDITLTGSNLQDFLRKLLLSYCHYGCVGILVDSPAVRAMFLSDEIALNIRPYWCFYTAHSIIGFRTRRIKNVLKLTQVRLSEWVDREVGLFGVVKIQQIRVLSLSTISLDDGTFRDAVQWQVYQKDPEGQWAAIANGVLDLPEIPFYMAPDFSYGYPPFLQIAFMNLSETRKKAELDHLLSLCANQKAVFSGFNFEAEEDDDTVTLGPEDGYISEDPNAKVQYVGASVAPATAITTRIEGLQREMMTLAIASMYVQKNVSETVESKKLDRIQSDSMMALIADEIEKLLNQAFSIHAHMMGISDPGKLEVNKDFSNEILTIEAAKFYAELVATGRITIETFFDLLIRGELLPTEFDADKEIKRLLALASGNK
jgi:Domain of unknown function (DUF4055)